LPAAWALQELLVEIDHGLHRTEALERVHTAANRALAQVSEYSKAHPSGDLGDYDVTPSRPRAVLPAGLPAATGCQGRPTGPQARWRGTSAGHRASP
jgi:hypothetical protein